MDGKIKFVIMFLFDFTTLGFYYLFKNGYYRNDNKYLGFGIEEHAVFLSAFSNILLLLVGIDLFCYSFYNERKFNGYMGLSIFLIVFGLFFIIYIAKGRLNKILAKKRSTFSKVIYSIVSLIYIVTVFLLFTWGTSFVSSFSKLL